MTKNPLGNLTAVKIRRLKRLIDKEGLTLSDCIAVFAERQDDNDKAFVGLAREQWHTDGEIEIDDNAIAAGSSDNGDYIMAWVWVDDPDPDDEDDDDDDDDEEEEAPDAGTEADTEVSPPEPISAPSESGEQ